MPEGLLVHRDLVAVSPEVRERLTAAGYPVEDPTLIDLFENTPKYFVQPVTTFLGRWFKRMSIEIRLIREGDLWIATLVSTQSGQRYKCFSAGKLQDALGLLIEFLLTNNKDL